MDRSRSQSRSRPRRRSPSPSYSRSPSRSRSGRSETRSHSRFPSRSRSTHDHHKSENILKTSAGLLVGIGVASFVAHKFWPKGVIHGAKEDWETHVKDKVLAREDRRAHQRLSRPVSPRQMRDDVAVGYEGRPDERRRYLGVGEAEHGRRGKSLEPPRRERRRDLVYPDERYHGRDGRRARPDDDVYIVERGPPARQRSVY